MLSKYRCVHLNAYDGDTANEHNGLLPGDSGARFTLDSAWELGRRSKQHIMTMNSLWETWRHCHRLRFLPATNKTASFLLSNKCLSIFFTPFYLCHMWHMTILSPCTTLYLTIMTEITLLMLVQKYTKTFLNAFPLVRLLINWSLIKKTHIKRLYMYSWDMTMEGKYKNTNTIQNTIEKCKATLFRRQK